MPTTIDAAKAAELLRQAAKQVETALVLLDMREKDCGECGTRHWANRTHAKVYQQFTNAPHNLRAAADKLTEQANGNTVAQSAKER